MYGREKLEQKSAGSSPWNCSSVTPLSRMTVSTSSREGFTNTATVETKAGVAATICRARSGVTQRGLGR